MEARGRSPQSPETDISTEPPRRTPPHAAWHSGASQPRTPDNRRVTVPGRQQREPAAYPGRQQRYSANSFVKSVKTPGMSIC